VFGRRAVESSVEKYLYLQLSDLWLPATAWIIGEQCQKGAFGEMQPGESDGLLARMLAGAYSYSMSAVLDPDEDVWS